MADPKSDEQGHAAAPDPHGRREAASLDTVRLSHEEILAQLRESGVEEDVIAQLAERSERRTSEDEIAVLVED